MTEYRGPETLFPLHDLKIYEGDPHRVTTGLDPHLQHLLLRHRCGETKPATASTGAGEVPVIAKVEDLAAWEAASEVRVGATIGREKGGAWLVTGRIPVSRIEHVRTLPGVQSLKAGTALRPVLEATCRETLATPVALPQHAKSNGGAGVVVGIVDYGCDFAHRNFRTASGQTRLRCIWHQGGTPSSASPYRYGRRYGRAEIDAALQQPDPYAALGYEPPRDTPRERGTHGTHVMDIAAGNGLGSGTSGVAPNAELVFVDVSHDDLPWTGPEVVERSFGDSVRLLEAIRFIFEEAAGAPCVVNVSLGTNGGPHDGRSLVEMGIDAMLREQPNRAVVIAAGNAHEDGIHCDGQVQQGKTVSLRWAIPVRNRSHDELEIWYSGEDRLSVEIIAPDRSTLLTVHPGSTDALVTDDGKVVAFVSNRLGDPNNGDNVIGVFLERGMPAGVWTVRLRGEYVTDGRFHAWIERDDVSPSRFDSPSSPAYTLGSLSTGQETIVVGSYDAHKPARPLSWFSSAGPTRDGRHKPEISAPGHDVLAAQSRTGTGVVVKGGTSMAAPAAAGVAALVLAEASERGLALRADEIRSILVDTARRDPPDGTEWDARYGHGRLCAAAAVEEVIRRSLDPDTHVVLLPDLEPEPR